MEFIDRKSELKELKLNYDISKKKLVTLAITGARRIGKTTLIKEFIKNKQSLYFFVYSGKSSISLLKEIENELKSKNIIGIYRKINTYEELMEILFTKCENHVIIFDEIQNMQAIYPSFFSLLQRKIDENQHYKAMFVFLGSLVGLIKKIFEDLKAPLYGRINQTINIKPLKYKDTKKMLSLYNNEEDFISFYSVFGGYPKYYVSMEVYPKKGLIDELTFLFFRDNAPLKNEVIEILRQEFGNRKSYYYDILEAIATGHTKLREIASYVNKAPTAIMPFLRDLIEYYEIIKREVPITENPRKSRNSIYLIRSPLFKFWFRFVFPNLRYLELRSYQPIIASIKKSLNIYISYGFEDICKEFVTGYPLVGKWWGHKRENNERKEIEIDIVALNEKEIFFAECKWKDNVNPVKLFQELKEKSIYVPHEGLKEKYAIFAKSFKNKQNNCYDLNDLKYHDGTGLSQESNNK